MRSRLLIFPVLLVLMIFGLGCGLIGGGGGDDGDGELGLIEFDAPPATPVIEVIIERALSFDKNVLIEVQFLYEYQVRLETMKRLNRDLISLLDYSNQAEIDLDWVIAVHAATKETEVFFEEVTALRVPESQREQYDYIFLSMLESVQVEGYGVDRLLASAILVGPNGRSLLNLTRQELEAFDVLMREAEFYLSDSQRLIEKQISEIGHLIGGVRIR